jgi:hypothetical protein
MQVYSQMMQARIFRISLKDKQSLPRKHGSAHKKNVLQQGRRALQRQPKAGQESP